MLLSVTDRYLLLVTDTSRAGRSGLERLRVGELRVEGQRDGPVPRIFRSGFKGRGSRVPNVSSPRQGAAKCYSVTRPCLLRIFAFLGVTEVLQKCNGVTARGRSREVGGVKRDWSARSRRR